MGFGLIWLVRFMFIFFRWMFLVMFVVSILRFLFFVFFLRLYYLLMWNRLFLIVCILCLFGNIRFVLFDFVY